MTRRTKKKPDAAPECAADQIEPVAVEGSRGMRTAPVEVPSALSLGANLTIEDVGTLYQAVAQRLPGGLPLRLDGGELRGIDGAGIQLLAAAVRAAGGAVEWAGVSDALRAGARQAGMEAALALG
ncbi:MAG: STAS domain-containing protein [Gammaproteobacteria bacterium]